MLRRGHVYLHEARPIRTAIPGTACSRPRLDYPSGMLRRGAAWLPLVALAIHAGVVAADPPPLCPYVPTLCPPTECGLVDAAVIPRAVNNLGQWAGHTLHCDGTDTVPIVWSHEAGVVQLPVPPQTNGAQVWALNDHGIAAGVRFSRDPGNYWACVWKDGQVIDLPGDGGGASNALAINNSNWVVGWRSSTQPGAAWMGFVWQDGIMVQVDPRPYRRTKAQCTAVANSGWVAGIFGAISNETGLAFRWKDGALQTLPPLPGAINSVALGVSDEGTVVGFCRFEIPDPPGAYIKPCIWGSNGTPTTPSVPDDYVGGQVIAVSSQGTMLGSVWKLGQFGPVQTKHVVWTGGQPHFLSQSIQPVQGASFSAPYAMSTNGYIVGTGGYPGTTGGGWLLTPHASAADLNGDCAVDGADLMELLSQWGTASELTSADFNLDQRVNGADLGILLGQWTAE
jgi:uncharacterized membrane protein